MYVTMCNTLIVKKFNYQCTDKTVSVHYSIRLRKFVYTLNFRNQIKTKPTRLVLQVLSGIG
jgi:hypothetical protein